MIEHTVQTISLDYSMLEDRLELRCKSGDRSYQIWMTQRMWQQLMPNLIKWLVDSGVGKAESSDFIRESFSQAKTEPVEVPASSSSRSITGDHASSGNTTEPSGFNHSDDDITQWAPEPWVCSTTNLKMNKQAMRVSLHSHNSDHVFVFNMSLLEMSHFLLAQERALKKSGWPFNWPTWLLSIDSESRESSNIELIH